MTHPNPTLKRFSARAMLRRTTEELATRLSGAFILVMDDGELATNARETLYSSCVWDVHRKYPNLPLRCKHHLRTVLGKDTLGAMSHNKLIANVVWDDWWRDHPLEVVQDQLAREATESMNRIFNFTTISSERNVFSVDILDFLEIMNWPPVKEARANVQGTEASIQACYDVITRALRDTPELDHNPLAKASKSGLMKHAQLLQCLGPRGFITDIDSDIFREPVLRGYVEGIRSFYGHLIESRSAAKSLFFTEAPLKASEYAARKLQLVDMVIEHLYPGDCGSQEYMIWHLQPERRDTKGEVYMKSDLEYFSGKFYLDEETGGLKVLQTSDRHLIGRTLKFRSPVAGCAHPDPHGVCATCFGELARSISKENNLGHMCAAAMTQQLTQMVLSTKHYDGSSKVDPVSIPHQYQQFLRASKSGNSYLLHESLRGKDVLISIAPECFPGITDIALVENVHKLGLAHVSSINDITMSISHGATTISPFPVVVSVNKRLASFTYKALEYIKTHGWNYDEKGNYAINMRSWDVDEPFLTLPLRHYNMSDHSKAVIALIESNKGALKDKDIPQTPDAKLHELYDTANSKLNVHISLLEIILLGAMVVDIDTGNFDIPKAGTGRSLGVTSVTIPMRSLSAAMAYEYHATTIMDPASFFWHHRPSHPMDVYLKPHEAVEDSYRPNF